MSDSSVISPRTRPAGGSSKTVTNKSSRHQGRDDPNVDSGSKTTETDDEDFQTPPSRVSAPSQRNRTSIDKVGRLVGDRSEARRPDGPLSMQHRGDKSMPRARVRERRLSKDSDDSDDSYNTASENRNTSHPHAYPPTQPAGRTTTHPALGAKQRSTSTQRTAAQRSLHQSQPGVSGAVWYFWAYVANAKWLSAFLVAQMAVTAAVSRQLAVLVMIAQPSGASGSAAAAGMAKRAVDDGSDLPPDLAATHGWLTQNLANTVSPDFAFLLLCTWLGLGTLLMGYICHLILSATDSPAPDDGKPKEASLYKMKRLGKAVWYGTKAALRGGAKVIAMDRHPSLRNLSTRWGRWTLIRIALFIVQLVVTAVIVRQTIAYVSLVAGAEPPTGFDLAFMESTREDAARGKTGDDIYLLVLVVLGSALASVTWSWYALLHPRQKDTRPGHQSILSRIVTGRIFSTMGPNTYRLVQGLIALGLILTFAACVGWYSIIMAYAADVGFVQDAGYTDSIGAITAFILFGLLVLPMGWVLIMVEDLLRWAWSSTKTGQGKKSTSRTSSRGRGGSRT